MCPLLIVSVFTDSSNKIVTRITKLSLNNSKHPKRNFERLLLNAKVSNLQ
jgi:hypothetical protein